jgi:3-hydroxybutyryl-CoA dehydrogenase
VIEFLLEKDVSKGKLTAEQKVSTLQRIKTTEDITDFKNVDFVIEAVSENPALKRELFMNLSKLTPKHAILATNTSSISITKIAAAAGNERAGQVIGSMFTLFLAVQHSLPNSNYEN